MVLTAEWVNRDCHPHEKKHTIYAYCHELLCNDAGTK